MGFSGSEPADGRRPKQPGSLAPAALSRGFPPPLGAPVWPSNQDECAELPGGFRRPVWRWIWRRAEGVRLPGCFGENQFRLCRRLAATQKQENFSPPLYQLALAERALDFAALGGWVGAEVGIFRRVSLR